MAIFQRKRHLKEFAHGESRRDKKRTITGIVSQKIKWRRNVHDDLSGQDKTRNNEMSNSGTQQTQGGGGELKKDENVKNHDI